MHDRAVERRLTNLLSGVPAVRVSGPRSSGKTTTCKRVVERLGGTVVALDDLEQRRSVARDPVGVLLGLPRPILVDEYHHVPEVLDVAKGDLSRQPAGHSGAWLFCGSVAVSAVTMAAESLGGRLVDVMMGTLTVDERRDLPAANFVDVVLEDVDAMRGWRPATEDSAERRAALLREACLGGFPLVDRVDDELRSDMHETWVRSSVVADAAIVGGVRDASALLRVLRRYAAASGAERPADKVVAQELELDRRTVAAYRSLLAELHVVWELPSFHPGSTKRQTLRTPKLHVVDSGLVAHLTARDRPQALAREAAATGALVETLVANNIRVQAEVVPGPIRLHHFRERRSEVDLVVEGPDGRVIGVEVKLSSNPGGADLNGLRRLREVCGDRFAGGVLLARVPAVARLDDDIVAAPVEAVWHRF